MKKTVSILITFLILLSLVSAFVTDDIESYEKNKLFNFFSLSQLAIKGPGVVQPGSTNTYYLILDTRTVCYGIYTTEVDWYFIDTQTQDIIDSAISSIIQPSPSRLITGVYYSQANIKFPTKEGKYDITILSYCGNKFQEEHIFVEVASKCVPECTAGQERCRDSYTKQVCQYSNGCIVWGTISTCPSNQICDFSTAQCKVKDDCTLNTRKCVDISHFSVCTRTSFGYEYIGEHFCPSVVGPSYKYCIDGECVQCRADGDCTYDKECIDGYCKVKEIPCDKTKFTCEEWSECIGVVQTRICTNECGDPKSEEKFCSVTTTTLPIELEICNDLIDNDFDGAIDCADVDCINEANCKFCTEDRMVTCSDGSVITTIKCVDGQSVSTGEECKEAKFPLLWIIIILLIFVGVVWFIIRKSKKKR